MLCQIAFLLKFVCSLGNEETIGKISLTAKGTYSVLVFVVNSRHRANDLLKSPYWCLFSHEIIGWMSVCEPDVYLDIRLKVYMTKNF